jgi:hypothetical protein
LSKYRVMYSQGNGEHCCCHRDAWLCIDDFDTVEQLREYLIEFYATKNAPDADWFTQDREIIDILEIKDISHEDYVNVDDEVHKILEAKRTATI